MKNPELLGKALLDYHLGKFSSPFLIHYQDLEPDEMPLEVFFREESEMPEIEKYALSLVKGSILDVGAGAGTHCLFLQEAGFDVSGLDISEEACEVMRDRGVKKVLHQDIFLFSESTYDTVLLLMNGIGIAESLENLPTTLNHLKTLLNPGGQILFDSSDLTYLENRSNAYFGEISTWYEYRKWISEPGRWLYVDPYKLIEICEKNSIKVEVIIEDETGLYLARVTR